MSLFKREKTAFQKLSEELGIYAEKRAEEFNLGDQVDNYQTEVANQAFQSLPYLSNYAVDVMIDKADEDRRHAFGNLMIRNKVDDPNLNETKSAKVPIIINEGKLKPFDLLNVDGKFSPLSEESLREALFSPNIAELTNRRPVPDKFIGSQTAPPFLGYGGSNGYSYGYDGMGKFASVIDNITISQEQKEGLLNKLSNKEMEFTFLSNPSFAACIEKIANKEEKEEFGEAICMQFKKLGQRDVLIKWASEGYEINTFKVSTAEAAQMMGSNEIFSTVPGDSIFVSTNKAEKGSLEDKVIKEITEFGQYKVQDVEGAELLGYVIPVLSFDNKPLPSLLFSNGSVWSMQSKISGELVGTGTKLPSNTPSGIGVFYLENNGRVSCFEPLEVSYSEGSTYNCKDLMGIPLTVELGEIEVPIKLSESEVVIPSHAKFMALPETSVMLHEDPITYEKMANLRDFIDNQVEITRFYDEYRISSPILKEASYNSEDAEFLLYTLGFNGNSELNKLQKHADTIRLMGAQKIAEKKVKRIVKEAEELAKKINSINLIKLAGSFKDENTIDKILSMQFLNSDNVGKYVDMIPQFEDTEKNLADLLFASRCGLSNVPEENVSLAMGHVGKLLKGLKDIKEKNNLSY